MSTLRVMTFNVRQPDEADGPNAWPHRRDLAAEVIRMAAPDVIGTQELHVEQARDLEARLPEFTWFGRGRYGDDRDKHVGIFVDRTRVRVRAHGDRWFSATPDEPGSRAWGIDKPRHLTWGVLDVDGVGPLTVINTHFPYRADQGEARYHAACLVIETAQALGAHGPVVVTGDFNAPAGSPVHQLLRGVFDDAWERAEVRLGGDGTVHGFGARPATQRIDWILFRAPWAVRDACTVTFARQGRYPSDHYPVTATFVAGEPSHAPGRTTSEEP